MNLLACDLARNPILVLVTVLVTVLGDLADYQALGNSSFARLLPTNSYSVG